MNFTTRCAWLALPAALLLTLGPLSLASLGAEPAAAPPPNKSAKSDQAGEDAELRLKVLEAARRIFVKVVITPKWDEDCVLESLTRAEPAGGFRAAASRLDSLIELQLSRRTVSVPGVLLGKGLVAIEDDGTGWEWKLIGKVEIVDASGRRWPARVARLMTATSAYVFEAEGDDPPAPPAWREDFRLGSGERALTASLGADETDPERWLVSCGGALLPFDGGPAAAGRLTFAGRPRGEPGAKLSSPGVLFDSEARPVGVEMEGVRLDDAAPGAWRPDAMLARGSLAWADVEKAGARASAETLRVSYKVRFEFRVDHGDDEEPGGPMARFQAHGLMRGDSGAEDAETFGVSVGGGRIFVPRMLPVERLRMLDKVSVKVGAEWKIAAFAGAFRDLAGMVVEVPGEKLAAPEGLFETKGVAAMTPFIYCQAEELLGEVRAEPRAVRFLAMRQGSGDRLRPYAPYVPEGALLFDLDGRLAGAALSERPERTLFRMAGAPIGLAASQGEPTLAGFTAYKDLFAAPAQGFEPSWRPMTREEQRRLCWLGVEFEPLDEELAKRLGCARETRGGQMGLIVSTVYPGSPAAKLGVKAQDILLRLKVEGLGEPLPLLARYAESADAWGGAASPFARMAGMDGAMGRTWKPRANFLTELLTSAGAGRRAEISYLASGGDKTREVRTAAFDIAWAPEDYDSAERHKDAKLGLAVKPITYEVREALGLKAEDPGVVISWIEQGSSAQMARLAPYMLILGVDGKLVRSAGDFEKAVAEARGQKKDRVRMQVSQMGNCRFADLKLGE